MKWRLVTIFICLSLLGFSQVRLNQIQRAPDSTYIIGAKGNGEAIWRRDTVGGNLKAGITPTIINSVVNDTIYSNIVANSLDSTHIKTGGIARNDLSFNAVSSVTATSPLFSSGGANPNITIQNASTSTTGAITATDWNNFNNLTQMAAANSDWNNEFYTNRLKPIFGNGNTPNGLFGYGFWAGHQNVNSNGSQLMITGGASFPASLYFRTRESSTWQSWRKAVTLTGNTQYYFPIIDAHGNLEQSGTLENPLYWQTNKNVHIDKEIPVMQFLKSGSPILFMGDEAGIWGTNAGSTSLFVLGNNSFNISTNSGKRLNINGSGVVNISNLATFGANKMVVANSSGDLSTQTIPSTNIPWDSITNKPTIDGSTSNELQTTGVSGFKIGNYNGGSIFGVGVEFIAGQGLTRAQTASTNGGNITFAVGNGAITPAMLDRTYLTAEVDGSNINEIDVMRVSSSTTGGGRIQNQTNGFSQPTEIGLIITGATASVSTGTSGSITWTLPDASPTNELQSLSLGTKTGATIPLNISSGGGVNMIEGTGINISRDASNQFTINNTGDLSETNEYNTAFSKSGNQITITDGGGGRSINISPSAPTTGQVLKWDGSNWSAGTDAGGTSYTGGTGIDITGSVITNTGDLSTTNEGFMNLSGIVSPYTYNSNTEGSTPLIIEEGSNMTITRASNTLTFASTYTDNQTLSTNGSAGNITISGGNTISINVNDADASTLNELDVMRVSGSLTGGGKIQNQTAGFPQLSEIGLVITGATASVGTGINGNITWTLPDDSNTNEIQYLNLGTKLGSTIPINITGGTGLNMVHGTGINITRDASNQFTILNTGVITETDPTVGSHIKAITSTDITNWNNDLTGITSLGGQTGLSQSLAYGQFGVYPTWSSSGNVHTFRLPGGLNGEVLKHDGTGWTYGTDLVNDADANPTNELQTISSSGAAGNITLSNGGGTLNLNVNDADSNPANEYNTNFTKSGNQITVTDGGAARSISISSADPASGEVLKWDGSNWSAGTDNGGPTYTAGTGISLASNIITNTGDVSNTNEIDVMRVSGSLTGGGSIQNQTAGFPQPTQLGLVITGASASVSTGTSGSITWTLPDASSTNEIQTISTSGAAGNITLSNGGGTLNLNVNDADASTTNEIDVMRVSSSVAGGGRIQNLTAGSAQASEINLIITGATASVGTGINGHIIWDLPDASPTNELQTISTNGAAGNISISSGNTLNLNVNDADASTLNEVQSLFLGTKIANSIPFLITLGGASVNIAEGNGIFLSRDASNQFTITNNGDLSNSNELQSISTNGSAGNITLSNGGGTLNLNVNDGDASVLNELQSLSFNPKSGSSIDLVISGGNGVVLTEDVGINITRNASNTITFKGTGVGEGLAMLGNDNFNTIANNGKLVIFENNSGTAFGGGGSLNPNITTFRKGVSTGVYEIEITIRCSEETALSLYRASTGTNIQTIEEEQPGISLSGSPDRLFKFYTDGSSGDLEIRNVSGASQSIRVNRFLMKRIY